LLDPLLDAREDLVDAAVVAICGEFFTGRSLMSSKVRTRARARARSC
jgi:hypothetical protein